MSPYIGNRSSNCHPMSVHPPKNSGYRLNLQDVITYFACTVPHLQEVKLDKLIYIAQLHHYTAYGELLTANRFFSMSFGPHAPTIRATVKKQIEQRILFWEEASTSSDPVYSNPCLIIKACEAKETGMAAPCLKTLQEVVAQWADTPYDAILDYTARTLPYLATYYRDPIDFSAVRPFRDLGQVLPMPQRKQIHEFVEAPDTPVAAGSLPLKIHDIVEIYLALCGGQPDRIPPRRSLGFNLEAVFLAVAEMHAAPKTGGNCASTAFDRAARLTRALLDSMSFKSYSGRVALIAGMLFLTKAGYAFGGDVLEAHWPEVLSPSALCGWFKRVSVKVT